jgi:site-specific recombinase XerD
LSYPVMASNRLTEDDAKGLSECIPKGLTKDDPNKPREGGSKDLVKDFINSYGEKHHLDPRTEKAYRMDLEHFYAWMDSCKEEDSLEPNITNIRADEDGESKKSRKPESASGFVCWEDRMEAYLNYLALERKLSSSTICRKTRVFGYYLSYLVKQGVIPGCRPLKTIKNRENHGNHENHENHGNGEESAHRLLSRKDADALFQAMEREYQGLESEFRKRVCLRDMVMLGLLFYHRIEISELLRIEVSDYDMETGTIGIRKKRGKILTIHLYASGLRRKMEQWLKERNLFLQKEEGCSQIFLSKYGKPLSMEMFIQIFDKYRKLAGIEKKLTPKDLKESSMKQYARELMIERCSGY